MDGGPDNIKFFNKLEPTVQNFLHIPLYGTLVVLWLKYFISTNHSFKLAIIISLVLSIGYGCLDEINQSFVRGRYGGITDVLLDSIGTVAGTVFFIVIKKCQLRQVSKH